MKKTIVLAVGIVASLAAAGALAQNGLMPETQRKILPLPEDGGDIIQFNNLTIRSISGTTPPAEILATNLNAVPAEGGDMKCYKFQNSQATSGNLIPCPLPKTFQQNASSGVVVSSSVPAAVSPGSPPMIWPNPYYRIQVGSDTRLLLRNRGQATLADFAVGDQMNVFGFYNTDGSIRALIVRNLSKPEEKRFIQLNNVELVSIDRLEITPSGVVPAQIAARLVVVQRPEYTCLDFGVSGAEKRILPCPLGVQSQSLEKPALKNLHVPESLAPVWNTGRKYVVMADNQTILLNRNRNRIDVGDLAIGDKLNIYGAAGGNAETIEADIIRDLSKPIKPPTAGNFKGAVTQVNADGSFVIQTDDGRLFTVQSPIQVGVTVKVKGILDELSRVISQVSEIILRQSVVVDKPYINIRTSDSLTGVVGQPFSATFVAAGGSGVYTFSVTAGSLPPGLSLSSIPVPCLPPPGLCPQPSPTLILLQGTPTQAGAFKFTLTAKDQSGNIGSETFVMTVRSDSTNPSGPIILNISPASGPVGTKVTLTGTGFYAAPSGGGTFRNDIFMNNTLIWPSVNFSKDGTKLEFEVTGPTSCNPPLGCAYTPLSPGVYTVHIVNALGKSNSVEFRVTASVPQ